MIDLFILFTPIFPPFGPRDNWFSRKSAKKEFRYSLGVIALSSMILLTSFGGMTVNVRTVVFPFSRGRSVQSMLFTASMETASVRLLVVDTLILISDAMGQAETKATLR